MEVSTGPLPTQIETFRFVFSSDALQLNRKLLCRYSRVVRRLLEQQPNISSLTLSRDYYNAFPSITAYVEDEILPEAPGCVDPDTLEARRYTEVMLLLCCFAETYEMDDLASRSMDALRLHEYQCQGSLVGRHIEEIYQYTARDSKLRHYCAVRTACFIWNTGFTGELSASLNDLLHRVSEFGRDVLAAEAAVQERARIHTPDCDSPENQFGVCEFHTHRMGGICHTAIAMLAEGLTVYISNLPLPMSKDDLMDFFKGYEVTSAYLPSDPRYPHRHAHVSLSSRSEAERAISGLCGKQICGRKISVKAACKPAPESGMLLQEFPEKQDRNNQSKFSRPPAPPGYAWHLQHQWSLIPIDSLPLTDTSLPSGTFVRFNDVDGAQHQQYTGSKFSGEQKDSVTSHTWNGDTVDSAIDPICGTAPFHPIKDEDPSNKDDSPTADETRAQVKIEDQAATVALPSNPSLSGQLKQRWSPRCLTCARAFKAMGDLRKHLQAKPGHKGNEMPSRRSKKRHLQAQRTARVSTD